MKKIAFFLALLTLISCALVSCSESEDEPKVVTQIKYIDVNTGKEIGKSTHTKKDVYVTPGVNDYDSDGNLIVTSTENRYVYNTPDGLVIFSFNGQSAGCYQVLLAKPMKDAETAVQYVNENIVELMKSGLYLNVCPNGRYVVYTMALNDDTYGKYLAGTKDTVTKDFPDETKQ